MTSTGKYKNIYIDITTYYHLSQSSSMNSQIYSKNNINKFICDMCLNSKPEKEIVRKRTQKTCPVCQRNVCAIKPSKELENGISNVENNTKEVQTSQLDVNPNLDLLDEVLKAFKTKKESSERSKDKTFKDVETSTEKLNGAVKLTRSKVFLYSIGDSTNDNKLNCSVVNSYPAEVKSIEFVKYKSSSIPQMKMDELKHALREKTKSKDAIEEVNRMFATVRKNDSKDSNENNRPMIRHGPRVLPVVKPKPIVECKYCQVNCMSSGDSAYECSHPKIEEKCDKCVYMLCCHYKNNKKQMQKDVVLCEYCREKHLCEMCSTWDESN